mmetsp:Transcript_21316/g.59314  ORF Transcript_21316/g.59314 Transcript_21316/m.59314 type:complete len:272 (-) Transcript_21316:531-1346(-)
MVVVVAVVVLFVGQSPLAGLALLQFLDGLQDKIGSFPGHLVDFFEGVPRGDGHPLVRRERPVGHECRGRGPDLVQVAKAPLQLSGILAGGGRDPRLGLFERGLQRQERIVLDRIAIGVRHIRICIRICIRALALASGRCRLLLLLMHSPPEIVSKESPGGHVLGKAHVLGLDRLLIESVRIGVLDHVGADVSDPVLQVLLDFLEEREGQLRRLGRRFGLREFNGNRSSRGSRSIRSSIRRSIRIRFGRGGGGSSFRSSRGGIPANDLQFLH